MQSQGGVWNLLHQTHACGRLQVDWGDTEKISMAKDDTHLELNARCAQTVAQEARWKQTFSAPPVYHKDFEASNSYPDSVSMGPYGACFFFCF